MLHNTLDLRGGADAVCLHTCQALERDHRVTLFTLSTTALPALNDLFDTDAAPRVRSPGWAPALSAAIARTGALARGRFGPQLPLRTALLLRYYRRYADAFDLVVSTANEVPVATPSVQYVHYPQFHTRAAGDGDAVLDRIAERLAGMDRRLPGRATVRANSGWTADVVEQIYGLRPAVLYPPVAAIEDPLPFEEREPGVVTLGRIAPDKHMLRTIRIVEAVRERGHDVHLHVVGTAAPQYRSYCRRVRAAAADRPWVALETDVPRARIDELLRTHRYAINGKHDEHFGMAVAEFVAAGMVVFAPDGGGQREILDGDPDRLYADADEAVELLDRALSAGAGPSVDADRFGIERFRAGIREAVAERLAAD